MNFDINAFLADNNKINTTVTTILDECKKRNQRIDFLNTELDNINKVLIPEKDCDIRQITLVLTEIDNSISSLKAQNVKGEVLDKLVSHRKAGITGLVALRADMDSLKSRATSFAREKSELTKIARGLVDKEEKSTRPVHTEVMLSKIADIKGLVKGNVDSINNIIREQSIQSVKHNIAA